MPHDFSPHGQVSIDHQLSSTGCKGISSFCNFEWPLGFGLWNICIDLFSLFLAPAPPDPPDHPDVSNKATQTDYREDSNERTLIIGSGSLRSGIYTRIYNDCKKKLVFITDIPHKTTKNHDLTRKRENIH